MPAVCRLQFYIVLANNSQAVSLVIFILGLQTLHNVRFVVGDYSIYIFLNPYLMQIFYTYSKCTWWYENKKNMSRLPRGGREGGRGGGVTPGKGLRVIPAIPNLLPCSIWHPTVCVCVNNRHTNTCQWGKKTKMLSYSTKSSHWGRVDKVSL